MTTDFTEEKQLASGWFRSLRDQIVSAFEELEETHTAGPFNDLAPKNSKSKQPDEQAMTAVMRVAA